MELGERDSRFPGMSYTDDYVFCGIFVSPQLEALLRTVRHL